MSHERNLRTILSLAGARTNRANWPTGTSERPVHNFPGNLILTFLYMWRIGDQEQARTAADHFAFSVVSTRKKGTGADSYWVEMTNGTGNFRNFQISRRKDNPERWTEIFETNFRKLSVPFDFELEIPESLVEWNAPLDRLTISFRLDFNFGVFYYLRCKRVWVQTL